VEDYQQPHNKEEDAVTCIPLNVLVVERDPNNIPGIVDRLIRLGAVPHWQSELQPIARLVNGRKLDGAFVNWDFEELPGDSIARCIRSSPSNSRIPIVAVTGTQRTRDLAGACSSGADYFVSAPTNQEHLARLFEVTRMAMLEERRSYFRAELEVQVQAAGGESRFVGHTLNVSRRGMLAAVHPMPTIGSMVDLSFSLPDDGQPVVGRARVVRLQDRHRVGLLFSALTSDNEDRVVGYVRRSLNI